MNNSELVIKWVDIIRNKTKFNWPEDKIEDLVPILGGKVEYEDLGYNDWYVKKVDDSFIIKIHNELSDRQKSFLIACGIAVVTIFGYFHKDKRWEDLPNNKDIVDTFSYTEEIQVFAAQLLMPRDKLFYEIDEYVENEAGVVDIKGLAKDYKLSENIVEWWAKYNQLVYRKPF